MNRKIKLSQGISYVIIAVAVLAFLAVWPGKLIQSPYVSKSDETEMIESEPVSVENNITQMFVGEGGELKSVDLYVYNDMQGETITFRLYDASYTQLFNRFYTVKNSDKTPGFINIPVGYCLDDGIDYFYTIEGLSADMTVALEDYATSSSLVNGYMSYGGIEQPEFNVIARYHYARPFSWWQILLIGLIIAAVTSVLCMAVKKIFERQEAKDKSITVQKLLQWIVNPLATVGFVLSILMIYPGRKLGVEPVNYVFFGTGFLLLYLGILYYVNGKRKDGSTEAFTPDLKKLPFANAAQSIAVAGMLWACYEYMNGLYDIHHAYAGYKLIFWTALMIITTYSRKEILNWINLAWAVAGAVICYFYARPYVGVEEQEELYRLAARAIFVCGFVVIHFIRTIIMVVKKKEKSAKLNAAFLIPYAGLFVLLCAFRNSSWPVFAAALCAAVFIRLLFWKKRECFVRNFCNGVTLNFFAMWLFCMWHRPYHKYIHHRYSMGFHTVTMTGTYLTLVMAAVLIRLLLKYKKDKTLLGMMPELILFGMVSNYILFTLSRTAYMATAGMGLIICILYWIWERKKIREIVLQIGTLLLTFVLMFPVTLTLTRVIPAFIDDPVTFDVEYRSDISIVKGCGTDSNLYMDFEHFIEKFMNKVIGDEDFEIRWSEDRRERAEAALKENQVSVEDKEAAAVETVEETENVEIMDSAVAMSEEPVEDEPDITNGRADIFKAYISEWNLTGHEIMEPVSMRCGHAHNIYLQVAHDHGLIVGIYFLIFILSAAFFAIISMKKKMKRDVYAIFPAAALLGFVIAGTVEWIFHICNPYGMTVLMLMVAMCFKDDVKE